MIKLRTATGKVYKASEQVRFVELCDHDGKLAVVIYINDTNEVTILYPADEEFKRYVQAYRPKVTKVIEA